MPGMISGHVEEGRQNKAYFSQDRVLSERGMIHDMNAEYLFTGMQSQPKQKPCHVSITW